MKQPPRAWDSTPGPGQNRDLRPRLWHATKRNAPLLIVLVALAAVGSLANRRAPESPRVPLPHGWAFAPEPGASLCLAVQDDVVWVGGKSGLFRIDRATGRSLGRVDLGLPAIHVRSLAVDQEGALWIGHVDGLIRLANGRRDSFGERDGLPNKRVNALLATGGQLYVGTGAGLVEFANGTFRPLPWAGRLPSPIVNVLFQSSDGALWVGSSSDPKGGVARIVRGEVETLTVGQGLPHPYVQSFVEPEPGWVWVATGQLEKGGAALLPCSGPLVAKAVLHKSDGLAGAKVRSLGVDAEGRVWFGSESDGLAIRGRGGATLVRTISDGLPHNEITSIQRDSDGTMWMTTLKGPVRISKEALPHG
ncbi:MAG: hypothetical protein H6534_02260 [Chthonomonadaceae bacterium]|nr:hypothetical protein [Chthonomonadaceae bacterium]